MTPTEWAGLAVAITTIFAAHAGLVKFLTKHYLSELKPNGGLSLKDKVNQLDDKVELLTDLVKQVLSK
jgi:hypothetical protein